MSRLLSVSVACLAAVSIAVTAAPGMATARHATSPVLRPTALVTFAWAHPGGSLSATVRVSNAGTAKAPTTSAHFFLSADKRHSSGDAELRGATTIPALAAGRQVSRTSLLTVPAGVRPGQFWVLACVAARCVASPTQVHVTGTPMTSDDLIAAAHKAGKLNTGTALTDQVLAEFGDPRLPVRFRGDDDAVDGDSATRAAIDGWASLSAGQRAIVGSYLQGPSSGAGWTTKPADRAAYGPAAAACAHKKPNGMAYVNAPSGPVRIWYENGDQYTAGKVPQLARDAAAIYNSFKNLMGLPLPSDAAYCGFNGGDGHYDVYILDPEGYAQAFKGFAVTTSYKGYRGKAAPSFTVFSSAPNRWQLAHELFHAFQFAYRHAAPLDSYAGFDEGAANWAANYMYPLDDDEHTYDTMMTYPDTYTFPANGFGYELWPFDLYLTEKFGNQVIPQIYQEFQHENELDAVNSVIPGGFADRLPDFTKYGWNQGPAPDGFRKWDRFDAVPSVAYEQPIKPMNLQIGNLERRTLNLPAHLAPLTRAYYSLHVDDAHIHDLRFDNTLKGRSGASVQAFVKLADGTWHTQDWTNRKTVEFCRDNGPDENVTDLVVMYANTTYTGSQKLTTGKQPTLELQNNCDRYYRVTSVTGSYHEDISVPDTAHGYACTDSGTEDFSLTVDPSGHIGATDGSYTPHGIGEVVVPTLLTGSRDYSQTCTGGPTFLSPCHAGLSAHNGYQVGIGDLFNDTDPVPVQVQNPHHQDPLDEACDDQGYGWYNSDNPQYLDTTTVSRATLEGTKPFTITATNTNDDGNGHKYTSSLSITLQPTDKNGRALG